MLSLGCVLALQSLAMFTALSRPVAAGPKPNAPASDLGHPDAACARCHREIYDRYERSSMARGSGPAAEGALEGGFRHAASGVTYKILSREDALWMVFERPGKPGTPAALKGERQLRYFIGSGTKGRTYLYEMDGYWFELPINYYGKREIWDMAPNYEAAQTMPAPLPVDANCLHCHATGGRSPRPEARNRWDGPPFEQGGVGCSACHGDGSKHMVLEGRGSIVNPDKLDAARRDDVCLQCHLEGDVVVFRPGRSLAQFRPGDRLDDSALYFVKASAKAGGGRATSQYEALLRSACKAGSGDRLTCTTCHDPHGSPSIAERVEFFRARCLTCHRGEAIAVKHHPEQQDCAVCHMPTRATSDISHEQVTDHNIQRVPQGSYNARSLRLGAGADELKPVGKVSAGDRELGLAYAEMAERGDRTAGGRAMSLLSDAEANGASDAVLHSQLGYLSQVSGHKDRAILEYRMALEGNPFERSALGNLAVLEASSGEAADSISHLRKLIDADPAQTSAGLNLAYIECQVGMKKEAAGILNRLQRWDPDDPQVRLFLEKGIYSGQRCELQ